MELSKRLQAVADMVTPGNTLVDVGCDHGYLPIYLVKEGRIPGALACDINKGPLMAAQKNIDYYGIEDGKIKTRLSDGLMKVGPGDGQSLVIAGMGGRLIISILEGNPETFHSFEEIILSPQSDIDRVRSFVNEEGYSIADECIVKEDGKYYFIMRLVKGDSDYRRYNESECKYGPRLIERRDSMLLEFLNKSLTNYKNILDKLHFQSAGKIVDDRTSRRIAEIEAEISMIEEIW